MNYKVENNTGFPIMIASDSGGPLEVDSGEIDKLWKVFGYASALAESNGIHNAESRIHRMIDYNGELEVCWKNSVDSGLSYYIVCAWARYSEGYVKHSICNCDNNHWPSLHKKGRE